LFRLKKYRYQTSGFTFQILFKNFIIRFLMKNIKKILNLTSGRGHAAGWEDCHTLQHSTV
jgi:hypothetical protein